MRPDERKHWPHFVDYTTQPCNLDSIYLDDHKHNEILEDSSVPMTLILILIMAYTTSHTAHKHTVRNQQP